MHSELMLSPSPSTSGTGGEVNRSKYKRHDCFRGKDSIHLWEQLHLKVISRLCRTTKELRTVLNSPVFLMGKSDLRCMVEGSSFMRSDSCRLKGEVF